MINRHIIQTILMEYNRNNFFARSNQHDGANQYSSSFYLYKYEIKKHNIEFKSDGKKLIIKTLESCFENNDYGQLVDINKTIQKTLKYIKTLKQKIEELPYEINKETEKYVPLIESKKINGLFEVKTLKDISNNITDKIKDSGYFEKTENYENVLLVIKGNIDEIINDKRNTAKIDILKKNYAENEEYLKNYMADISPITNEIDIASKHLYQLFKNIREIGITTCNADCFFDDRNQIINKDLTYEITSIQQDTKYKNLYMFNDNSILFEDIEGIFFEVQDNDHLIRIQNEIMFNSIGIEFKKYPTIEKLFKTAIINKPDYLNRIIGIAVQYQKYSTVLKAADFKILDEMITYINSKSGYEMLEEIRDKIQKIAKKHNVRVFAHSISSKKNKNLYDDNVMDIMELLYDLKIEKEVLQEQVGSKIAAYKTPEDFYQALKKLYGVLSNFSKEQIVEKTNEVKTKIIYETEELVILEIDNFSESSLFGAPSWCISRDEEYFRSYTKNGGKQYIVYTFKIKTPVKETLIGITLNDNLIKAANYRNNDNIDRNDKYLLNLVELIKQSA